MFFTSPPCSGNPPLPNPYGDTNLTAPVMPVQQLVAEILFVRTSYVKKIIEDCSNSEETVKLLRFSCWENPQFSSTVLSELLWQVIVLPCRQLFGNCPMHVQQDFHGSVGGSFVLVL